MTKIEKAVRIVSDLYEFYRRVPKIAEKDLVREERREQEPRWTAPERISHSFNKY